MVYFSVLNCFTPSLHAALSVVSMELWSPHKMAEISFSTQQRGGAGSENMRDSRVATLVSTVH